MERTFQPSSRRCSSDVTESPGANLATCSAGQGLSAKFHEALGRLVRLAPPPVPGGGDLDGIG